MRSLATASVDQCSSGEFSAQPFPLSPAQTAMFYAQRIRPDVPLTIAQYVEIHGDLDAGLLLYSIERFGAETEVGMVRIVEVDGVPRQVVDPWQRPGWERVDFRGEADPHAAALQWMNEHSNSPIDLDNEPLITNAVLRTGEHDYIWYARAHHIVIDGYGAMNALTRTAEIYTAVEQQAEPVVSRAMPLEQLYADESSYRESSRFAADREYWHTQLDGAGEPASLATITSAPDAEPGRLLAGAVLDQRTEAAVAAAAETFNASNPILFAAALACYVRSVTGDDDVVLSLPVSARTTVSLRRSAGVVSNVVPLRVRFDAATTVDDVVRMVERQITGGLRHQRYRHDDIRRDCGYSRDARGFFGPMVNIMLFHNELRFGDLVGSLHVLATGPVEDLSVNLYNGAGDRIHIDFEGNPQLYGESELAAHHDRFLDFLDRFFAAATETPASALPAITAPERQRVLHTWNATATIVEPGTLSSIFAERAAICPEATAVEFEGQTLTYRELDAEANRLARLLIARGAGPERVVGLCLRRSLDLVVGMYAIVKSGAAYVPLDPDNPIERQDRILAGADPVVVLVADRDSVVLPQRAPAMAVDNVDLSGYAPTPVTDDDRRAALREDHLAYLIFTSGSTGTPKGVGVSHASIVNRLRWMQHEYGLDVSDTVLQKTPATFDVSVWEFFWPLQVGARLVLARPDGHRDPEYLAAVIAAKSVTIAHFVPSMLSVFVTEADVGGCSELRRVFCSGEGLQPATVRDFRAALPGRELHNLYGPTEAAVDVTYWPCPADPVTVPIGSPVWNTRTYVLDARLQPVPPGVVGELYLAGVQLARGYIGRSVSTADRFVADPFTPGTRMYRTGDLARWQLDGRRTLSGAERGVLEYLGRTDFQVKIRGLRIELGEIEAALLHDERIARAVCIARTTRTGDQLIGYVVASPAVREATGSDPALDTEGVLAELARLLPAYMVPTTLVELDELPLSANGKIDRAALPAPAGIATGAPRAVTGPRTEVERVLVGVFAEVLDVDEVGIEDGFFDMGGNSLIAARAVARINTALGAGLTIRDLFEAGSISALTERFVAHNPDVSQPKLAPATRPQRIPLSPAQQRLWILNRFAEHAAAYNMPLAVQLDGRLDLAALRAGLRDVLERHESLRTTFPETAAGPYQHIHSAADIPLHVEPIEAAGADIAALATEFAGYGFDLRGQAPIRVALYSVDTDRYVFVLVLHHICGDGWSVVPLARDLMTAVAARSAGTAPTWAPLPVQYADFALWQRELLGEESDPASALSRQVTYWRSALSDLPDQMDLPLDRPRPPYRSTDGGRIGCTISPETRRAAAELAASRGVSMFMVLHAALATLLSRLCGSTDIVIGTPIAGRSDPDLDELVGMFVNTLVLRTEVDPGSGFDRMLDVARETDLNAFANADVPFERLVEVVNPERSGARHPLFQVMLSYDSGPEPDLELPGVRTEVLAIDADVAKFDLQLEVHDDNGDGPLRAEFGYATDVFDQRTVEAFARRLIAVLDAVVAAPDAPVGDIDLLDARENANLVPLAGAPAEPACSLARMFGEIAERVPDRVAVNDRGRDTTYRELDQASNRLARVLIDQGAGPEAVVAVALPRGLDAIVTIWAVAKTGAAYVPIDPDYPRDRITHMLGDSGALLGITSRGVVADLPEWPDRPSRHGLRTSNWIVLGSAELDGACVERSASRITDADRLQPLRTGHPAYLIYTSGSTGTPKAVIVGHAGLASFASEQRYLFGVTDTARTLHFASPSFDASVLELLLGVTAGATIVVAPPDMYGGSELAGFLRSAQVTHAFITPAALATVPPENVETLEAIMVGGEACSQELVDQWASRYRMYNMYGPSEATVAATMSGAMRAGRPAPLGHPVRGMRLFVLDSRLRPVPPGTPGELYLSGPGLARGYHNRHGLTAARFPANPHGRRGERMYRTGDLVVADRTGRLRFLGRADDQIKIRGFRIELHEIDHVLREHPGVRSAFTIVHTDEHGRQRLASYITAAAPVEPADVIATARRQLPGYMVPAALTVLDALPVASTGKLDRKALPEPVFGATVVSRAPETEAEQQVATLFGDVLSCQVVGAEDSFFDLGGNSLLATRLIATLHERFGVDLPVRAVFEAPTVAGLAGRLADAPAARRLPLAAYRPRPARIPLSLPQQRVWFLNRFAPESSAYNIAFVLDIEGDLDVPALRVALADVIERHEVLRTVFPEDGDGAQQVVLPVDDALPQVEPIDTDAAGACEVLDAVATTGFDLSEQTPLRVALLRIGQRQYRLGFAVHHIAADGWSLGPLTRDLAAAYQARHGGTVPAWTPLPVQYADFGLWQREYLGADTDPDSLAASQLDYWRKQLADLPEELPLPFDGPRPTNPNRAAATVHCAIPESVRYELDALARGRGLSRFMVLRSALAVLLRSVTGGRDIAIGSPIAGRNETQLDDLVGMFVNTLVLRSDVDPDVSFAALLRADRDTELAAMAGADIPFERVVEELGHDPRATGRHPLFQVALTVADGPRPTLELPGLALRAEELEIGRAKFDLEMRVVTDGAGETGIEFVYASELFDAETVRTLAGRFLRVLAAVTDDPRVLVRDIDTRTEAERNLLAPAYGPAAEQPSTLAALFEAAVQAHPHRVVVRHGPGTLSYAELDRRANQLARGLIHRGIGTGDRVALGLNRSIESVAVMLAVAKTGAAYVPIDPDYPAERVGHMLADSGCVVGVSMAAHAEDLVAAAESRVEWLLLDDPALVTELGGLADSRIQDTDRLRPVRIDDLAYLIYTSGSTGKPKGVAVTHGGLANLAAEFRERLRIDETARTMHFSSPSFDAAMLDLLCAIGSGAEMVIVDADVYGGDELGALLTRERVTHGFITPTALATIDQDHWPLPDMRVISVGGEACGRDLVARWAPGRFMENGYGPTETTVVAVMAALEADRPVVIGTLVRGAHALVLDERLRAVPVGVPGQLYLGGPGLARGYFERFGLTAARFVADPYGPAGARVYRTGDVVQWNTAGELVYLGRSDDQVKVRGFRIELGEITATLAEHPDIRFVHTEVRAFAGAERIVSYIQSAEAGRELDLDRLRAHAAAQLPSHMVPAALTVVDRIPLTPVGKLDTAALPQPQLLPAESIGRPLATDTERRVAEVIGELVGADDVLADDSFFDRGGNSLMATQLVARLAALTGTRLEVRTVFAAPTVAEIAAKLDCAVTGDEQPELVPRVRPQHVPLSPAQRRLWFLDRFNDVGSAGADSSGGHGSGGHSVAGAYNVPVVLRLRGDLDLQALAVALHTVQGRHETLRTVFPEVDGEPAQVVLDPDAARIQLQHAAITRAQLDRAVREFLAPGFDLATQIPLRAALIRVGDDADSEPGDEHVLVLVVHHIAMDGWSLEPLASDIAEAYRYASCGDEVVRVAPAIQYADYTLWLQDVLGIEDDPDSVISRQLAYWCERLAGLPELLSVPADRPRPPAPSYRGGTVGCAIGAGTHRELRRVAIENNVSMFMVLHTALAVLLHRMTGTEDIAVGTPVAGRGHPELDRMVGMFVNTLVLRTRVDPDLGFGDLLHMVRDTDLDAFANAELPFERLVEVLNPARSQSHHPLFQVMLSVRNEPIRGLDLPELRIETIDTDGGIAKFDLQFTLTENYAEGSDPAGIGIAVNYSDDLFEASTAARFGSRLARLLDAVAANSAAAVGDLDVLDPVESSRLVPVRGAQRDRPCTLPEVFTAGAQVDPAAVALRSADTEITYAALDLWSNRLARVLIARGVGPETLVALGIARSVESVATVLAVAKTGAAFVPVDPNYPAQRIAHMLADSGAELGLTLAEYRADLPSSAEWLVLDDPHIRDQVLASPVDPITDDERVGALRMENPAYVIYTSGSTGIPKGVVVSHGGLSNFAAETAQRFEVGPHSRVLHFATPSFDAAVLDLLLALGGAATLVITPPGVVGGAELRRVFVDESITHAFITTSALGTVDPEGVTELQHVMAGGEALPPELVARWAPGRNLHNVYGPTETTIVTLISSALSPEGPISIGGPIRGVDAAILDARLHPAPTGVAGELYLSGSAVARGYLNRPGLTAQRFVANPFGKPGERMYRTGDLVRVRDTDSSAGPEIDYVGRSDHQVKIRGFRIEPGEIDAALARHEAVEFATTMGHRTGAGVTALVSYVKPCAGVVPTAAELTDHLAAQLPNYMVPQSIMLIDSVPLNRVGKLDRAALPEPVFRASGGYRAPRTDTESKLCTAFAEVLGVTTIGVEDGFFELGGNSLLATKVVAQLRTDGIDMPVQLMFGDSTPAAIAARVDGTETVDEVMAAALAPVLPIRADPGTGTAPLFCVHPAIGLSWCYVGLLPHLAPDRPVYGLQAPHVSGGAGFDSVVSAAEHYVRHIRSVQPHGPYHLLGWSLGGLIAHEVAVQLQHAGQQVALLAMMDSYELSDNLFDQGTPTIAEIVGEFGTDVFAGAAPDPDMTLADAAELLRSRPGPFAALTVEHLERLYAGYSDGTVQANNFHPHVFDGDLLFFSAVDDDINRADPQRRAVAWRPHITGSVHDCALQCTHAEMTTPESLSVIGPVLRSHLGAPVPQSKEEDR